MDAAKTASQHGICMSVTERCSEFQSFALDRFVVLGSQGFAFRVAGRASLALPKMLRTDYLLAILSQVQPLTASG